MAKRIYNWVVGTPPGKGSASSGEHYWKNVWSLPQNSLDDQECRPKHVGFGQRKMKFFTKTPPPKEKLEKIVKQFPWFHSIDLGMGIKTPGQTFPGHTLTNLHLLLPFLKSLHLKNAKVLDVGTWDGKMAFLLENLGAEVLAVDVVRRETLLTLIKVFSSNIQTKFDVSDKNISQLKSKFGQFDFILCAGVFYHVYSPIELILALRKLIKNNGYMILEGGVTLDENEATMLFHQLDYYEDHTTVWLPSIACLRTMVKYACFEIIAEVTYDSPIPRHAMLVRAKKPSELAVLYENEPFLSTFLSRPPSSFLLPQYNWDEFEKAETSNIKIGALPQTRWRMDLNTTAVEGEELLQLATPAWPGNK